MLAAMKAKRALAHGDGLQQGFAAQTTAARAADAAATTAATATAPAKGIGGVGAPFEPKKGGGPDPNLWQEKDKARVDQAAMAAEMMSDASRAPSHIFRCVKNGHCFQRRACFSRMIVDVAWMTIKGGGLASGWTAQLLIETRSPACTGFLTVGLRGTSYDEMRAEMSFCAGPARTMTICTQKLKATAAIATVTTLMAMLANGSMTDRTCRGPGARARSRWYFASGEWEWRPCTVISAAPDGSTFAIRWDPENEDARDGRSTAHCAMHARCA
eukprot:1159878-Pelagomonas_calceolata.AAC.5